MSTATTTGRPGQRRARQLPAGLQLVDYGYAGFSDVLVGRADLGLIQKQIDGRYSAYHRGNDLGTYARQREAILALVDNF